MSWPCLSRLAASRSMASSVNSLRGWSGSGTIRSISMCPASRARVRPSSGLVSRGTHRPAGPPPRAPRPDAQALADVRPEPALQALRGLAHRATSPAGSAIQLGLDRQVPRADPVSQVEELGGPGGGRLGPLDQLVGDRLDRLGRGRPGLVGGDRLAGGDGLLEVLGQRDRRPEDLVAVEGPELVVVGRVDPERLVEHRHQVARQPEPRVVVRQGQVEGPLDVDDPLGPVVLGLDRDDDEVGRQERRPRAEAEVRRAVDQGDVEVAAGLLEEPPEGELELAGLLGPGDVVVVQRVRAGDDRGSARTASGGSGPRGRGRRRRRTGRRRSPGRQSSVAWGPKRPWVSDACGSMSTSRTRRPSLAKAPARWWQVEVLPHPPLRLSIATVIGPVMMVSLPRFPRETGAARRGRSCRGWDRHFPRETGRAGDRFPGKRDPAARGAPTLREKRTQPAPASRPPTTRGTSPSGFPEREGRCGLPGKTNPTRSATSPRSHRAVHPRPPGKRPELVATGLRRTGPLPGRTRGRAIPRRSDSRSGWRDIRERTSKVIAVEARPIAHDSEPSLVDD